ncbi:MAG TPA: hypothetical protein VE604_08775 [Candidatus Polarisedimenticolia bacterium]|nr:hypothetical protein [Candidatus Polarisedimenticolia bacterium]
MGKIVKRVFILGFMLLLLTISAAAVPRIVQSASAQSPANFCPPSPCTTAANSLTVTFSPTVAGDTLVMIYIGFFEGIFPRTGRVCADSSGTPWGNTPELDEGGVAFYFPPTAASAGLTSITCIGGIVNAEAGVGPSTITGFSSIQFIELSPTQEAFLGEDQGGFTMLTAISPLNCTSSPIGGFELRVVRAQSNSPVTFTPQSSAVHPLFTIGPMNAAVFYALDSDSQFINFAPSPVPPGGPGATAFCIKLTYPFADLVDPVPGLMKGPTVIGVNDIVRQNSGADKLGALGRPVQGVAADGVTQAVIRVAADGPGDQFTLTVMNDQLTPSVSPDEDGALGNPGDPSLSITQSQISVTAVNTSSGVFAFAVYRAPVDFARSNGQDVNSASRKVTIQIFRNSTAVTIPITIVRTPVALIHGLWSDWKTWNGFSPLVTSQNTVDARFSVLRVSYDKRIDDFITVTNPVYVLVPLAKANSMGFAYNAPTVLSQMSDWLQGFKNGSNPARIPVAAAQFDVVAHSMGGDIARTLPLLGKFQSTTNFGLGTIHKVITIGTPHQGSPLPGHILDPASSCIRTILSLKGNYAFASATVSGTTSTGAVGDLGTGSPALQAIQGGLPNLIPPNTAPVPTAMIAGQYNNWASLDCTRCAASTIRATCSSSNDPLAQLLTSTGWQSIFAGPDNRSDALVGVSSQFNGLGDAAGSLQQGFLHASALAALSFATPAELDSNTPISNQVIEFLNTPFTDPKFKLLGPSNIQ